MATLKAPREEEAAKEDERSCLYLFAVKWGGRKRLYSSSAGRVESMSWQGEAKGRSRTKEPCNFHSMLSSILGKSAIRMITKEPGALERLPQGSANFTALLIYKILR